MSAIYLIIEVSVPYLEADFPLAGEAGWSLIGGADESTIIFSAIGARGSWNRDGKRSGS